MNYLTQPTVRTDNPYAVDWAPTDSNWVGDAFIIHRDVKWASLIADEFEISPIEIVQAFLRAYSSFTHAEPNIAAQWERLFAIGKLIGKRQSQFDIHEMELLFSGQALDIYYHTPRLTYGTQFLESDVVDVAPITISAQPASVSEFIPSDLLINIWTKSITALAREAGGAASRLADSNYTTESLLQEFTQVLQATLATLAQQLRYEGTDGRLTQEGEFTSRAQIEICDAFLILPSLSTDFLSVLKHELVTAVNSGWMFSGAWGDLELTQTGELNFRLELANFATDREFVRARRVE